MRVETSFESAETLREDDRIKEGRDAHLTHNLKTTAIYSLPCLIILSLCLRDEVELWKLSVWASLTFLVVLSRTVLVTHINKAAKILSCGQQTLIAAWLFAAGLLWGIAPFLLPEDANPTALMACIVALAGLVCGSTLSFSTHPRLVLAYNIPVLSLIFAYFALRGGTDALWMCIMIPLFFGVCWSMTNSSYRTITGALMNEAVAHQKTADLKLKEAELAVEIERRRTSEASLRTRFDTAREFNAALERLFHASLESELDLNSFAADITERLSKVLHIQRVSVWVFNAEETAINCIDLFDLSRQSHSNGIILKADEHPRYFEALATARVIAVSDARSDVRTSGFTESYLEPFDIYSLLDAPIRTERGVVGVVCCEAVGEARLWSPDEIVLTASAAQLLSQQIMSDDLKRALKGAQDASIAKSQFLANMSHEIRTPMNGIMGFSEVVLGTDLSASQRQYLEEIRTCSRHLMRIVDDILDISRIEAGSMEFVHEEIDIESVVRQVSTLVKHQAQEKGLTLNTSLDTRIGPTLYGDEKRLKQILINLLSNAIKFTDHGGIELTAELNKDASSDVVHTVTFTVSDTGVGISEKDLNRIFERFTQVDASMERRFGGTGLGLAICQELVTALQGTISVESEFGKGTTFHVSLPFETGAQCDYGVRDDRAQAIS